MGKVEIEWKNEVSAIKGYWRMGATVAEISAITTIAPFLIEKLIQDFEKKRR